MDSIDNDFYPSGSSSFEEPLIEDPKRYSQQRNYGGFFAPLSRKNTWRMVAAELIGTFILIAIGVGSILSHNGSVVEVVLGFSGVLIPLIYAFEHVSGAHFNPVVSLVFCLLGETSPVTAILFIVSQFVGSTLASGFLFLVLPSKIYQMAGEGNTFLSNVSGMNAWRGLIMEIVLTFVLVLVILSVAYNPLQHKKRKPLAPIAIGSTLGALICFGGPISGASMNPARSFGTALISNYWKNQWIYFAGPTIGGIVALVSYRILIATAKEKQ